MAGTPELTHCRRRKGLGFGWLRIENADGPHPVDDCACGLKGHVARPARQDLASRRRRAGVVEEGGERDPTEIGNRMFELWIAQRPRPPDQCSREHWDVDDTKRWRAAQPRGRRGTSP